MNRDAFAAWRLEMRRLEPEHWRSFVAWEFEMWEMLRDAMARLADLEEARAIDLADLADRGVGSVGFLPDDDSEVAELHATVRSLRAHTPTGYTDGSS